MSRIVIVNPSADEMDYLNFVSERTMTGSTFLKR